LESEKKRILFITVRSDIGGGPFHVDLLINNLDDKYDIFIAAPINGPYGYKWKVLLGDDKFIELPFRSFKIITLIKLISFIKNNKIEIVHAHGRGAGIYSRLAKMFYSKFISVYTLHGFHIQQYKSIGQKFYIFVERFLSGFTDLFINVSYGEKNACLSHRIFNESKSVVVYNSITNIEKPSMDKIELRKNLMLPQDKFIVISVVSFNTPKNVPLIITIAEQLAEHKNLLFAVIGDGEQRKQIEESIELKKQNNILLLGSKTNVNEYLFAADIFLSTSLWEGMPYSLIEATAAGLPIVASNVTGNNEIVENDGNGFLFELNQPEGAAQKIVEILNSNELLQKYSRNSIKIFNEKFELAGMIEKMKDIYNRLASENKNEN
jgi:glycosyltransferase involved in cell wall biosynthesis